MDGMTRWLQSEQEAIENGTSSSNRKETTPALTLLASSASELSAPCSAEDDRRLEQDDDDDHVDCVLLADTKVGKPFRRVPPCDFLGKGCDKNHLMKRCPKFINMTQKQRYEHIKVAGRCYNCFRTEHKQPDCPSLARCQHCKEKHNTLMHEAFAAAVKEITNITKGGAASLLTLPCLIATRIDGKDAIAVNAIIDNGSTTTILDKKIGDALNARGLSVPVAIDTIAGRAEPRMTLRVWLYIFRADGSPMGRIEANIRDEFIKINAHDWSESGKNFDYFKGICFDSPAGDASCSLLIGNNNSKLIVPQETRESPSGKESTYAIKTRLGWAAAGSTVPRPCQEGIEKDLFDEEIKRASAVMTTLVDEIKEI